MALKELNISKLIEASFGFKVSVDGSKTIADIEDKNATLILNCTYIEKEGKINDGHAITWRIKDGGNLVGFAKPWGPDPIYYSAGMYLRNRSELIKPTENSKHALIIINEVVCEDEEPSYECSIGYNQEGPQDPVSEGLLISLQKSSKRPLDIPLIQTTELQENEDLGLACVADVGKPPGIVKWWRFRTNNDFTLIKESDQIPNETGNCEFVISFNITHTVTKEDNGAFFRCTSHNNISKDEGPKDTELLRDTMKINVLYEAKILNITKVPELNFYPVSTSRLNLTCLADGNPIPTEDDYKWTFQSFYSNTIEEKRSTGKFLILQNLQEAQSGTYTCSVSNSLNSTHSWDITILVVPKQWSVLQCNSNPCGALEICVDLRHKYKM
ncbi:cell adhesion molecule 3-like [Saccostrea echinata]|uniref:cell adhesion molecule 3-like n=1 Tax=Saccostrea echinata TaxID=191078 RepID=UPI002A83EF1A|nr:cell adhesion molecule 3-like [Saccostrea echinata]